MEEEEKETIQRVEALTDLAQFFTLCYRHAGNLKRLDIAIAILQHCIHELPLYLSTTVSASNALTTALYERCWITSSTDNISYALLLQRKISSLAPPSHQARCTLNLAKVLRHYTFIIPLHNEDLGECISLLNHALVRGVPTSALRFELTVELAKCMHRKFIQNHTDKDLLNSAIDLYSKCMGIVDSLPVLVHSEFFAAFSQTLLTQYIICGDAKDLDHIVSFSYRAQQLIRGLESSPTRWWIIDSLARGLYQRANNSGSREDLDVCIAMCRDALKYRKKFPSVWWLNIMINLGIALHLRFRITNRTEDLDEAIAWCRIRLSSHLRDKKITLRNNLAHYLGQHFQKSGNMEMLDEAILLLREANAFVEAEVQALAVPNSLGNALLMRAELFGTSEDIEEAIAHHRRAVKYEGSPQDIAQCWSDLARAWRAKYSHSQALDDLEEAHFAHNKALHYLHPGHSLNSDIQRELAETLILFFQHTTERDHLEKAVQVFRSSALFQFSSTWHRFRAAVCWAEKVDSIHESALEAYEVAITFLPQIADLSLSMQFRQDALKSGTDGLARNAAACALRKDRPERAVELLEAGRGVFWMQLLQLRTAGDTLRDIALELQEKLAKISWALEHGAHANTSRPSESDKVGFEKEEMRLRNLNDQWMAMVKQVRKLPGFGNFLLPLGFQSLQEAAHACPVIILNAATSSIDALIMTKNEIKRVILPEIDIDIAHKLVQKVYAAAALGGRKHALSEAAHRKVEEIIAEEDHYTPSDLVLHRAGRMAGKPDSDSMFRSVLGVLWDALVKPILSSLDVLKEHPKELSRIIWCPTGPLAFLPIHAAGRYSEQGNQCTFDYVISSYTPTIGAMRMGETQVTPKPLRMMTVVQPKALPQTEKELKNIQARIPSASLIILGVPGSPATVNAILKHLPNMTVVHFACHGEQDSPNPLESALLVDDGRLKISEILKQPLPNASLAFLCACQTAKGAEDLPDEAIHLGAALLFAGFRSVVGTMWSIADDDGPKISDAFYKFLCRETVKKDNEIDNEFYLDTSRSAEALHYAVKQLRESDRSFARWVPYIHMGR